MLTSSRLNQIFQILQLKFIVLKELCNSFRPKCKLHCCSIAKWPGRMIILGRATVIYRARADQQKICEIRVMSGHYMTMSE